MMEKRIARVSYESKIIEKGYAIILDLAMLVLGIVMIGFFVKELGISDNVDACWLLISLV